MSQRNQNQHLPTVRTNASVLPQIERSPDISEQAILSVTAARAIYALLLGALLIAEKDETPGAAERCREIALAAEAYFPLTGLEKPSWVPDAIAISAVADYEVHLD